jgi:hypothetical protein
METVSWEAAATEAQQEGAKWRGKKDVAIPVSDVDFCDADTFYLRLAEASVKALPAVRVKRP